MLKPRVYHVFLFLPQRKHNNGTYSCNYPCIAKTWRLNQSENLPSHAYNTINFLLGKCLRKSVVILKVEHIIYYMEMYLPFALSSMYCKTIYIICSCQVSNKMCPTVHFYIAPLLKQRNLFFNYYNW